MITYKKYRTFTPHDPFVAGNNLSYFVGGHYPIDALEKTLRKGMFIPSDEVMARQYPTVKKIRGMHPFFAESFAKPTLTYSYFNKTDFYTTLVHPTRVHETSAVYE